MNANRMAELFQLNLDGLDEDQHGSPAVDFSQKINDVQSVLLRDESAQDESAQDESAQDESAQDESAQDEDTALIMSAIHDNSPAMHSKSDDSEIKHSDVLEEVESDIQDFQNKVESEAQTDSECVSEIPDTLPHDKNNPLGLSGFDLKAYREIKEKYGDVFTLYDGSIAYRDFYKYKVHALRHLLGQFPLLDIADMRKELSTIQTNHFIGDDVCTPDLIRSKLDSSQAHRTRLSSLLTTAFAQYHAWERFLDMSRSKLWKDHDIKGAHKRDGMVMEHLSDMESYVASLKGFIDAGKQYDNMLKSAADSLSRQLTCLQLNEYVGTTNRVETTQKSHSNSALDGLDVVNHGTVVRAPNPKPNEAVTTVSYGEDDELSQLG